MPNQKRHLKVFLCHASGDKEKVHQIYMYLVRRGVNAWLDSEKLLPGQNWRVEIPKAIEESDAIIICLSNESVDKEGYVQKEIQFALDRALEMPEGRIFLIPARLEECVIPRSLSDYQWVDLFGGPEGFSKLRLALNMRAEQVGCVPVQNFHSIVDKLRPPAAQLVPTSPVGYEKTRNTVSKARDGETEKPFWQKTEGVAAIIGALATLAAALIGLVPVLMPGFTSPTVTPTITVVSLSDAPTWTATVTATPVPPSTTATMMLTATPSLTIFPTPTPEPAQSTTLGPTPMPSPSLLPTLPPERLISFNYKNISQLMPPQRFTSPVYGVDISPENRWVASGERNGRVTISTVSDLALFKQFNYNRIVYAVVFSPNGRWLAVAGEGGEIMIVDTLTWEKPVFVSGHTNTINALDFSPDGSLLVSGGLDGTLRLWDVPAFTARNVINTSRRIYALDVDPTGRQVAVGASDGIVRVWNTDGQPAYELESADGPSQSVIGLQFSPDGDFLAVASSDPANPYLLWEVQPRKIKVEFGSGLNAKGVGFSPDGLVLVTYTRDRQLAVWRATTGSRLFFVTAHQDEIWAAAVSRDGTLIATCSGDKTVRLWGIP